MDTPKGMEYKEIDFSKLNVRIRQSEFTPAGGVAECHAMVTVTMTGLSFKEQALSVRQAVDRILYEKEPLGFRPVFMRYYLSDAVNQAPLLAEPTEPVAMSIVEQPPLNGTKIALWLYMVTDADNELSDGGLILSRHGGYCHVWSAGNGIPDFGSETATMTLLDDYAIRLENLGIRFTDSCVRTWFFVQDVDVNYSGVVKGRNSVFKSMGLTPDTHFIASTGIGGRHKDHRVRVQLDAYAVGGLEPGQLGYLYAPDHLNSTCEYGVAFERGATVDYGDRRHIFISGTASIDNKGRVVHPGDVEKQTDRMLENVGALLTEGGATFRDVSQMTIYLRDPADYTTVDCIFAERFPHTPRVIVLAPVCRPGWLIEMECMAATAAVNPQYKPL